LSVEFVAFIAEAMIEEVSLDEVIYSTPEYRYRFSEREVVLKDLMKKYGDNLYVSLTSIQKLGINPQSNFSTPIGIYSYPAEYAATTGISKLPFAAAQPFIQVFSAKNPDKIFHVRPIPYQEKFNRQEIKVDVANYVKDKHFDRFAGDHPFGLPKRPAHGTTEAEFLHLISQSIMASLDQECSIDADPAEGHAEADQDVLNALEYLATEKDIALTKKDAQIRKYIKKDGFANPVNKPLPELPYHEKTGAIARDIYNQIKSEWKYGITSYYIYQRINSEEKWKNWRKKQLEEQEHILKFEPEEVAKVILKAFKEFFDFHDEQINQVEVDENDIVPKEFWAIAEKAAAEYRDDLVKAFERFTKEYSQTLLSTQQDVDKLKKLAGDQFDAIVFDIMNDYDIRSDGAVVWLGARILAERNPRKWNAVMQQMGYDGVHDHNTGTIHTNERTQAVFFSTRAINHITEIENRDTARNRKSGSKALSLIPADKRKAYILHNSLLNAIGDWSNGRLLRKIPRIIKLYRAAKQYGSLELEEERKRVHAWLKSIRDYLTSGMEANISGQGSLYRQFRDILDQEVASEKPVVPRGQFSKLVQQMKHSTQQMKQAMQQVPYPDLPSSPQ